MQVHHFIYTRLVADKSPDNREGFQIAYRPPLNLDRKAVSSIKNNITWYQNTNIEYKKGFFFVDIDSSPYLVILNYFDQPGIEKELPEIVGSRAGIFLCHGFLFPQDIWKKSATIFGCMQLIKDNLFTNLEHAFSSQLIDTENGLSLPVDIDERTVQSLPSDLPALHGQWEWDLVLYLQRSLADESAQPVLFKATPDEALNAIDRISAYIPNALKPYMRCDTAQDQGNMYYAPYRMAAWSTHKPSGGKPVEIDLASPSFSIPDKFQSPLKTNPLFDKTFNACRSSLKTTSDMENLWQLGIFLHVGAKGQERKPMPSRCFANECPHEIETQFSQAASDLGFREEMQLRYMLDATTAEQQLAMLLSGLTKDDLISLMERQILKQLPPPSMLPRLLAPNIVESASPLIKVLSILALKKTLRPEDMASLDGQGMKNLAKYLAAHFASENWVLEAVERKTSIGEAILSLNQDPTCIPHLTILLQSFLQKKGINLQMGLAQLVLEECASKRLCNTLFHSPNPSSALFDIMEQRIRTKGFDKSMHGIFQMATWKRLMAQGSQALSMQPHPYPCLNAFVNGILDQIPKEIVSNPRLRQQLIETCCRYHRHKEDELLRAGFTKEEIEHAKPKSKGLFSKLTGRLPDKYAGHDRLNTAYPEDFSPFPRAGKDHPSTKSKPRKKPGILERLFGRKKERQ